MAHPHALDPEPSYLQPQAGLHTCGDLAPTMLRSFTEWGQVRAFCGVGCCYNLLTQEVYSKTMNFLGGNLGGIGARKDGGLTDQYVDKTV